MSIEVNKQRLVRILLDYESQVRQGNEIMNFVERIIDEKAPDPDDWDICDMCRQKTSLADGRFYPTVGDNEVFICKWCKERDDANCTEGGTK